MSIYSEYAHGLVSWEDVKAYARAEEARDEYTGCYGCFYNDLPGEESCAKCKDGDLWNKVDYSNQCYQCAKSRYDEEAEEYFCENENSSYHGEIVSGDFACEEWEEWK